MNERIQNMLYQAINAMPEHLDFDIPQELAEKFAELIVRECISTLEEKIYRSIDNEGDEIWTDLILTEHFGVEE